MRGLKFEKYDAYLRTCALELERIVILIYWSSSPSESQVGTRLSWCLFEFAHWNLRCDEIFSSIALWKSPVHQFTSWPVWEQEVMLSMSSVIDTVHKVRLELKNWGAYLNLHIGTWERIAMLIWIVPCVQLMLGCWRVLYLLWAQSTRLALANLLATHLLSKLISCGMGVPVTMFSCLWPLCMWESSQVGVDLVAPDTDPNTSLLSPCLQHPLFT